MSGARRKTSRRGEPAARVWPERLIARVAAYETRVRASGGHIYGMAPPDDAIRLISNDYLSLARHGAIIGPQGRSLLDQGNGILMSSVFIGEDSPQRRLERRLAAFMGAEDGVLSQSGWCTNAGLIQALADPAMPVYLDMFAHMSLWEGARSSGAPAHAFRHNCPESLERLIAKFGPGLVVIDAIYSTNGSVAPLADIVAVAERDGSLIVVDESHSLGTHGPQGQGMVAELGLTDRVQFRTASLAKAFAGRGGIAVGPRRIVEFVRYESRPAIFSSTLLPHDIVGFDAALDVIIREDWRRQRLVRNANYLRRGLAELGYNVSDSRSQIISLEPGPERRTARLRDLLEARGVFGSLFAAPATPKNRSLLRFSVNCELTRAELDRVIAACAEVREPAGYRDWPSTRRARAAQAAA